VDTLFDPEHDEFRRIVADFIDREIRPHYARWEEEGRIDRALWPAAAELGLLGLEVGPEHGGMGLTDWRFRLVVVEELGAAGAAAVNTALAAQDDLVVPALLRYGTAEQQERWLPGMAAGTALGAVAITEPGAGSDLRSIRTSAVATGDGWVLNGQKAFVSSGLSADVLIVAAATASAEGTPALTLFLVDADQPGVERGRPLHKLGLHAQDTVEVFLTDCHVGSGQVLGRVGAGLAEIRSLLQRERLAQAAISWAEARAALDWAAEHVFARKAFGQVLGDLQNTRFALAETETGLDVTRAFLEQCVRELNEGELSGLRAAQVKYWAGEQAVSAISRMLQLFGGYGFMEEYPIARAYRDCRVQTIYAGTSEVMKEIIGRDIARRHSRG